MSEPSLFRPTVAPVVGRPRIATPADIAARTAPVVAPLVGAAPFSLDHCLDTGVGIAFESVGRFDLLTTFVGSHELQVLSEVVVEVRRRAMSALPPGHDPRDQQVRRACQGLQRAIDDGGMQVKSLGEEFFEEVLRVQALVANSSTSVDGHDGEAATIVWAGSQRPRAAVLTNDGGAQRVATSRGVRTLNSAQVMAALVDAKAVPPQGAFDLVERMNTISGIAGPYPRDAGWLTSSGHKLI